MEFQFIEPEIGRLNVKEVQPASYLRKCFSLSTVPDKVELFMTALGVYKAYLNGEELDPQVLLPGYTNYHARVQYQSYEVKEYLRPGENVLAIILGDGWYRGSAGVSSVRGFYGDKIKFAARMVLNYGGKQDMIVTDETWRATQNGYIRGNDNKLCELVDMTCQMDGWKSSEFDDSDWHYCKKGHYSGQCIPSQGEKILEHERFSAKVLRTPNGETVLDFGQNLAGHVEFTVTGPAGHIVCLRMGETLDENGNFTQKNVSGDERSDQMMGSLGQKLQYRLKEGRQTYKSTFLISGYRYVLLENWPEKVVADNFTSIAIYSDLRETGNFACSNENINQLLRNSRWTQKSNFVDVPTDCPTRERAGWMGDINVFCETACYYTDVRKFLYKYLEDVLSLQRPDGNLPFLVPEVPVEITPGKDVRHIPYGSAGWSNALVHIPMILYQFYADQEILKRVYPAVKRYMEFETKRARKKHWTHFYKIGRHCRYILDTGFQFGEWLEPGHDMGKDLIKGEFFPDAEVATAWFFYSAKETAEMAKILGYQKDYQRYEELANNIRSAYRREFLNNGKIKSKRQCRYVRPIDMGLVSGEEAKKLAATLNELVTRNNYKIGTGFLTTYRILHVLSDYGYAKTAYRLLLNEQCPGWMYEIKKGATTIWENWMGIDENGVPKDSMNHYAPGANLSWLYSHCAGIRPLKPGFAKVLIRPFVGGGLTWVEASYESIKGKITSNWKIEDDTFFLHVECPCDIEVVVQLPGQSTQRVVSNGVGDFSCKLA